MVQLHESNIVHSSADLIEWSEYYSLHICPKCRFVLNENKARYYSKCCYICGHSTGSLFDCKRVTVRDKYVNGKFIETIQN
jgi:hypothetical protein